MGVTCRSSYRGVKELLRDMFDVPVSIGTIHNRLHCAAGQAAAINRAQDLSPIRVGLHDEIFQGSMPVLAGVDAASTYCYLLTGAEHRDADTWAVHLLDVCAQGFKPDHTIADAGQGLREGQKVAMCDTPCHGDVFHILQQCQSLVNVLARLAKGAISRCRALDSKMENAKENGCGNTLSRELTLARQTERQPYELGNLFLRLRPEEFSNHQSEGALGAKPRQLVEAALHHVNNANDNVLRGLESLGQIISCASANEERGMDLSVFMGIGGLISHLAVELEFLQELDFGLRERLERVEQKGAKK